LAMSRLPEIASSEERAAALRELFRICRGHLVISFFDRTPIHRAQRAVSRIVKRRRPPSFLGIDAFRREAAAAGFEILAVKAPIRGLHAERIALLFATPRIRRSAAEIAVELGEAQAMLDSREF